MKRILLVFGTRPEAIKMAPLIKCLQNHANEFDVRVCVTGQHRSMLDQVLDVFGIKPDYDLDIMKPGQDLYDVTAKVVLAMRDVCKDPGWTPEIVLVHGDTTTSTAAALAAFYTQIPVGHVEAGLRTHNIYSPWPEEMNRQLTGRIASVHFAPTELGRSNLMAEGVNSDKIHVTGNTVIDALHLAISTIDGNPALKSSLVQKIAEAGYDLANRRPRMVLVTGHRRENFGQGFTNICTALRDLARRFPDIDFVYPMHLNPNVRSAIEGVFGPGRNPIPNMHFIEPLEYFQFLTLMREASLILTDSGGIQEEAPAFGIPVLVMRDTTERPEAVTAGTVKLVGADYDNIFNSASELLDDPHKYSLMSKAVNPYGDGHACERIARALAQR